jgi:hypothetical protein
MQNGLFGCLETFGNPLKFYVFIYILDKIHKLDIQGDVK